MGEFANGRVRQWASSRANWPGADREDFASEVIYRLLEHEDKGKKIKKLNAFTDGVIRRTAKKEADKAQRRNAIIAPVTVEDISDSRSERHSADSFTIKELLADMEVALEGLPEPQREVIICRIIDNLELEESAEALGIPVGTIKSREHRGLKKLRNDPALDGYNVVQSDPD